MTIKLDHEGRKIRGYAIISKGDMPERLSRSVYCVPSQSQKGKYYIVFSRTHKWECECPDWQKNEIDCKHIYSIRFWLETRDRISKSEPMPEIKQHKDACASCKSENIIKRGKRKNKQIDKQTYFCKDCGKRFVIDIAVKTKGNGQIVTLCLDLYFKGISLRKIQDHLQQLYGFEVSHMTIQRWIHKFMKIANEHANAMKPQVGGMWHSDEQMIKCNGDYIWVWNCIDAKTRFLLANNVTKERYIEDATAVLNKAKTNGNPDVVVTDGLHAYPKAMNRAFGYGKVEHVKADGITSKKKNNNMIERFHNTFRERDKVMRGFKNENSARFMTESFRTYYNHVKKHQVLGVTPSEMCGIGNNNSKNKWLSLIQD